MFNGAADAVAGLSLSLQGGRVVPSMGAHVMTSAERAEAIERASAEARRRQDLERVSRYMPQGTTTGRISSGDTTNFQQIARMDFAGAERRITDSIRNRFTMPRGSETATIRFLPIPRQEDATSGLGTFMVGDRTRERDTTTYVISTPDRPSRAERRGNTARPGVPGRHRVLAAELSDRLQQAEESRRGNAPSEERVATTRYSQVAGLRSTILRLLDDKYRTSGVEDLQVEVRQDISSPVFAHRDETYIRTESTNIATVTARHMNDAVRGLLIHAVRMGNASFNDLLYRMDVQGTTPADIRDIEVMAYGSCMFLLIVHDTHISILRMPNTRAQTVLARDFNLWLPIFREANPVISNLLRWR